MENFAESQIQQTESKAIVIDRIFEAPRELVWRAWTDPALVARWWGPTVFTAPSVQIDFRVGGKNLLCMRSPDGQDFWSTGTYLEIDYPNRIVVTDSFADEHGSILPASVYGMDPEIPLELLVTTTFEKLSPGRTKFRLQHEGLPAGELSMQTKTSWKESFDKLEKVLDQIR